MRTLVHSVGRSSRIMPLPLVTTTTIPIVLRVVAVESP